MGFFRIFSLYISFIEEGFSLKVSPIKETFCYFLSFIKEILYIFLPYNDFLTFYYIDTRRQTNRLTNIRFCKESLYTATIQGLNT